MEFHAAVLDRFESPVVDPRSDHGFRDCVGVAPW